MKNLAIYLSAAATESFKRHMPIVTGSRTYKNIRHKRGKRK